MKKFSLICLLLISITAFSQSISGQAFYESKTTVDMDGFGGQEMTEEMKKMVMESMKSMLEKTYILTFSGKESIYKEEEKLEAGMNPGFRMMMSSFSAGAQYKNLDTKQMLEEREFFGKQFLVSDTIASLDWQLEKESKQIGQYVAFKATAVKKIDANDLSMARQKKTEKKEGEAVNDSIDKNDPWSRIEIPTEVLVTAWYTPMIPVSNGPAEYTGLPGLILELNVHRTTILCSKIIMNPKEAEKIAPPTTGKKVTRQEFNLIVKEKTEEMRENFQGGNREIRIGG